MDVGFWKVTVHQKEYQYYEKWDNNNGFHVIYQSQIVLCLFFNKTVKVEKTENQNNRKTLFFH